MRFLPHWTYRLVFKLYETLGKVKIYGREEAFYLSECNSKWLTLIPMHRLITSRTAASHSLISHLMTKQALMGSFVLRKNNKFIAINVEFVVKAYLEKHQVVLSDVWTISPWFVAMKGWVKRVLKNQWCDGPVSYSGTAGSMRKPERKNFDNTRWKSLVIL